MTRPILCWLLLCLLSLVLMGGCPPTARPELPPQRGPDAIPDATATLIDAWLHQGRLFKHRGYAQYLEEFSAGRPFAPDGSLERIICGHQGGARCAVNPASHVEDPDPRWLPHWSELPKEDSAQARDKVLHALRLAARRSAWSSECTEDFQREWDDIPRRLPKWEQRIDYELHRQQSPDDRLGGLIRTMPAANDLSSRALRWLHAQLLAEVLGAADTSAPKHTAMLIGRLTAGARPLLFEDFERDVYCLERWRTVRASSKQGAGLLSDPQVDYYVGPVLSQERVRQINETVARLRRDATFHIDLLASGRTVLPRLRLYRQATVDRVHGSSATGVEVDLLWSASGKAEAEPKRASVPSGRRLRRGDVLSFFGYEPTAAGQPLIAAKLYRLQRRGFEQLLFRLPRRECGSKQWIEGVGCASGRPRAAGIPATLRCQPGMQVVPAGAFWFGDGRAVGGGKAELLSAEAFCIDRTEVSQAQYNSCVQAGGCEPRRSCAQSTQGDEPANCVDQHAAAAYCRYRGARLPTETEWEYAARGNGGRRYPWGDRATPEQVCSELFGADKSRCPQGTADQRPLSVASHPEDRSPFEVFDMAGNVREWTASKFCASSEAENCSDEGYAVRGASYLDNDIRSANRYSMPATDAQPFVGFRCAK